MGGTAAAALGLTKRLAAIDSSPGGSCRHRQFMNNLVQNEQPVRFVSGDGKRWRRWTQNIWAISRLGRSRLTILYFSTQTSTTPPAGSSAPTTDPAGTYSGPGASAPTPAAAGTYIPVTGATSAAAEIVTLPAPIVWLVQPRRRRPAGTYATGERADYRPGRHVQRRRGERANSGGGGHVYSLPGG